LLVDMCTYLLTKRSRI